MRKFSSFNKLPPLDVADQAPPLASETVEGRLPDTITDIGFVCYSVFFTSLSLSTIFSSLWLAIFFSLLFSISFSYFFNFRLFFVVFSFLIIFSICFFFLVPSGLECVYLCLLTGVSSIELPSVPHAGCSGDKSSAGLDGGVFGDFKVEGSSYFRSFQNNSLWQWQSTLLVRLHPCPLQLLHLLGGEFQG